MRKGSYTAAHLSLEQMSRIREVGNTSAVDYCVASSLFNRLPQGSSRARNTLRSAMSYLEDACAAEVAHAPAHGALGRARRLSGDDEAAIALLRMACALGGGAGAGSGPADTRGCRNLSASGSKKSSADCAYATACYDLATILHVSSAPQTDLGWFFALRLVISGGHPSFDSECFSTPLLFLLSLRITDSDALRLSKPASGAVRDHRRGDAAVSVRDRDRPGTIPC